MLISVSFGLSVLSFGWVRRRTYSVHINIIISRAIRSLVHRFISFLSLFFIVPATSISYILLLGGVGDIFSFFVFFIRGVVSD